MIIIPGIIILLSLTLGEEFNSGFCRSSLDMEGSQDYEMCISDSQNTEKMDVVPEENDETVEMMSQGNETEESQPNDKSTPGELQSQATPTKPKVSQVMPTKSGEDQFPTTLGGFGYHFKGQRLLNIKTDEPFRYEVKKDDREFNQKHYEALGEVITEEVYNLLESETHLKRHFIPVDIKKNEAQSFFFASEDAFTNPIKLMILIHGSGVVRAGQWSRRLIINDCLDSGTQLPFIKRAMTEGYGVVVFNGNRNYVETGGKKINIRGSSTPERHGQYVWRHFISKSQAKRIDIVAHSYGGVVVMETIKEFFDDFRKRVQKIAFTDSVHNVDSHGIPRNARRWITLHSVNWVSSEDPLDTPQESLSRSDVRRVSAGTPKHEETSWRAFESIFQYFATTDN